MDIEREQQLIEAIDTLEKEFKRTKRSREVKTWLFLSVVFYILAISLGWMQNINSYLIGILWWPFMAFLYMCLNISIFTPMIEGSRREAVIIERLYTELNFLRRE